MAIQAQLSQQNLGFPLCGSQDSMMENGCGFNKSRFNLQLKQQGGDFQQQQNQQQQQQQLMMMNQNTMQFGHSSLVPSAAINNIVNNNELASFDYSQNIAVHMEAQRRHLDHYLRLQNEKLRLALQEHSSRQFALLVKKMEANFTTLMRQKDVEIALAAKKTMELEEFLKKLEMEKQGWQRVAQEKEAMVTSLNNAIEELREKACCSVNNGAEDAESCCDVNMGDRHEMEATGTYESRRLDDGDQRTGMMVTVCKSCNYGESCMLFLPCRHLCSCKICDAFLDCCPVCTMPKKASIEVMVI